ncbi:MAG TPA: dTDP-4-dehydrorhamnose 3,5-epimerase [Burkholderiales bacterium]|nr:dTDP-4-dehydrorhamnose 3,5-epimerase [Burkholderiales bacterium]
MSALHVAATDIPGVLVLAPRVFADARGAFFESWNEAAFARATGVDARFVQDNHSVSMKSVLRGLHYQLAKPQGKLVRVVVGEVYDVAVDLRRSSKTFGRWTGVRLSAGNRLMQWVPVGCAHGFVVLSERAEVLYKTTEFYSPADERSIAWNDPDLAIDWPLEGRPLLSDRDARATRFAEAELFP